MPATTITEDLAEAEKAVERYGVAVVKPLYSTKARGMLVLSAREQADWRTRLREFKDTHSLFYIQQRVDLQGRDYGLVFLAGEYQGAYARVGHEDSWNTTVQSGGKYASFDAPAEMVELAKRAQAPFQLDFTTVDVAQTQQGPVVFEVSAFGGFRGAEQGFQWDAAAGYAEHALQVLR